MIWPIFTLSGIFCLFQYGMLSLDSFNHIFFPSRQTLRESIFLGKLVSLFSESFSVGRHFIAHFRLDFNSKIIYLEQNIPLLWPMALLLLHFPSDIISVLMRNSMYLPVTKHSVFVKVVWALQRTMIYFLIKVFCQIIRMLVRFKVDCVPRFFCFKS